MKPFEFNLPHLVIMIGIPGSGKSYFANNFAKTFNAPLVSHENIKKHFSQLNNFNSKSLDESIADTLQDLLIEISKTKRTIIFDSELHTRSSYDNLSKITKQIGYEPLFIWVQTDVETSRRRSNNKANKQIQTTHENFDRIVDNFNPIDRTKKNLVVISGKHTYSSQLKIVLSYLSKPNK